MARRRDMPVALLAISGPAASDCNRLTAAVEVSELVAPNRSQNSATWQL